MGGNHGPIELLAERITVAPDLPTLPSFHSPILLVDYNTYD